MKKTLRALSLWFVLGTAAIALLTCKTGQHQTSLTHFHSLLSRADHLSFRQQLNPAIDIGPVRGFERHQHQLFFTSNSSHEHLGWLYRVDSSQSSIDRMIISQGSFDQPGNCHYDGSLMWIPVSEGKTDGNTRILGMDPDIMKLHQTLHVSGWITSVTSDGAGHLYGLYRDSGDIGIWDLEGRLLRRVESPTHIAYQSLRHSNGLLVCMGQTQDKQILDIIDPFDWSLRNRMELPGVEGSKTSASVDLTLDDDKVYCVPESAAGVTITVYRLNDTGPRLKNKTAT